MTENSVVKQDTSRFASRQTGGNFRPEERQAKNRRSAIETNENSELQELCQNYEMQYSKKKTMVDKKESLRNDVSDLSESITSKSGGSKERSGSAIVN